MSTDFVKRTRRRIEAEEGASLSLLQAIDSELRRAPTTELWILRGDAIQLGDGEAYSLEDAEASYRQALALDPLSAEAWAELAYFTFAVKGDSRASLPLFKRAIELGSKTAREGLRAAVDDLAEFDDM